MPHLHLNIRSLNKKFENLKFFLSQISYKFSMISITETWCSDDSFSNNSNFNLSDYHSFHLGRKEKRAGGICVFVLKNVIYKFRDDLSHSNDVSEMLTIEIINQKTKNAIVSTCQVRFTIHESM